MDDQVKLRTKLRTKVTKTVNDTKAYRDKRTGDIDPDYLAYKIHQLKELRDELKAVQLLLDKGGNLDESPHSDMLAEEIFMASRLLTRLEGAASGVTQAGAPEHDVNLNDLRSSLVVKIPTFNGDLMKWRAFWELFSVSIHSNSRYANVQKFVILKSHLSGTAEKAIDGIPVSGDGYLTAVDILQKRFQREDVERENHMKQILDTPTVHSGSDLKGMRSLVDHLSAHTRALLLLGVTTDSFSCLLLPVMKDKIPESWRLEWVRQEKSSYEDFLAFLEKEVTLRESARCTQPTTGSASSTSSPSTTSALNVQRQKLNKTSKSWTCEACGLGQHGLNKCHKYQTMTVDDRWKTVRRAGVCYQCLGPHRVRFCQSQPCPTCRERHHSSLHHPNQSGTPQRQSLSPPVAATAAAIRGGAQGYSPGIIGDSMQRRPQQAPPLERQSYNATVQGHCCFYQTARVVATGPKGRRVVRVLLDGASDSSFIRASLAKELGLKVTGSSTFACMGFQEKKEELKSYDRVRVNLRSRFGDHPVDLDLWSTDRLCAPVPETAVPPLPESISDRLADDFSGGPIDILIGIDRMYDIILWEQEEIGLGLRAIDTVFGFIIHGRNDITSDQPEHHVFHSRRVEEMWDLDSIGISETKDAMAGNCCLPTPTWSDSEQRYEMGLVWKSESRPVSNFCAVRARTHRMAQRLNGEEARQYQEKLSEMLCDAVIEETFDSTTQTTDRPPIPTTSAPTRSTPTLNQCTNQNESAVPCSFPEHGGEGSSTGIPPAGAPIATSGDNAFFLPHHGIRRNGKLRIVFDGSAKDGAGQGLNDYLNPGDNLLRQLAAVVLNFRTGKVACQADIKAAFHQVAVTEPDRKYLQFLWQDQMLRFTRVPFGLSCSPFMLLKTINTHIGKYAVTDKQLCEKIASGTYMDDICLTFDDREEAIKGTARVEQIFSEAKMDLHKVRMSGDKSPESNLLGMVWSTEIDSLAVTIPDIKCPTTKSELLSAVARPFDPLGVLTPWLIGCKIAFQSTWKRKPSLEWEDPLPTDIQEQVQKYWMNCAGEAVSFPRALMLLEAVDEVIFHVFCDASTSAYCAVVYVVHGGESRLVMSKGRLAPLNPNLTVPRLELMAALIGARLMTFIKEVLQLGSPTVVFWTDSMDVLHWLWNDRPRKVFVENRVRSILSLTRPEQWKHVRGTENPADLGTRGTLLTELKSSKLWWNGPPFLLGDYDLEESMTSLPLSPDAQKETKKERPTEKVTLVVNQPPPIQPDHRIFDVTECSTLKQVVNRTSWVLRFIHNARSRRADRRTGPLTPEERRGALHFWIREAQQTAFSTELETLRKGTILSPASTLAKLRPQLDENGVLCSVPRTNEPMLPILPELAHVTTLIIDEAHQRCFHQGVRATLALLSADYLVRRRNVKRVVDTCRRCRRYRGLGYRPVDGTLPAFRTEPSRPFSKVGMDFFGPLYVDDSKKVWVLLITCATSRAVHLELVQSQGIEDVKLALRRFFALRGTPVLVFSDNAKTFRALLSHIPSTVTWRFIPEAAPWWGGFWERLVGVTKKCLKITLHLCRLSCEELAVTLYELAYHLNLRPLTTADEELLTPAHLLFGVTHIKGVVTPSHQHLDHLNRAWKHRKRVCDHLIRRWTSEYIAMLRSWSISPHGRPIRTPTVGDIVLVHGEGPRGRWPLALVEALITGPDGRSRAAVIRIRGKQTRRPISKLYHLEADNFP